MTVCVLCKSSEEDDVLYGDFLTAQNITVHTGCLYLSSNLIQRGTPGNGLLGFSPFDILQEARRTSPLRCFHCQRKNASIGCCESRCNRSFHLICGIKSNCLNQYIGFYKSYCPLHLPSKYIGTIPTRDQNCCICYEKLYKNSFEQFSFVTMIRPKCCRNGWFHKYCMQKSAKLAGYLFRCPLCNDRNQFREGLQFMGIYIPEIDAAWEREPNAYEELLQRPSECSAVVCQNLFGRNFCSYRSRFIFCETCGSSARHITCLPSKAKSFHCDDCDSVINKSRHVNPEVNVYSTPPRVQPTMVSNVDESSCDFSDPYDFIEDYESSMEVYTSSGSDIQEVNDNSDNSSIIVVVDDEDTNCDNDQSSVSNTGSNANSTPVSPIARRTRRTVVIVEENNNNVDDKNKNQNIQFENDSSDDESSSGVSCIAKRTRSHQDRRTVENSSPPTCSSNIRALRQARGSHNRKLRLNEDEKSTAAIESKVPRRTAASSTNNNEQNTENDKIINSTENSCIAHRTRGRSQQKH